MAKMAPDSPKRSAYVWRWVASAFILIIVVYPLSYGPWCRYAVWSAEDINLLYVPFYAPLAAISNNGPKWLADPYNAYLKWWIRQ